MERDSIKLTDRTCWADLQFIGLTTAGFNVFSKDLAYGGRHTILLDDHHFSGHLKLSVTLGGLRSSKAPTPAKKLFKQKVMPTLAKELDGFDPKYSGSICLHYNEGHLTEFKLTP